MRTVSYYRDIQGTGYSQGGQPDTHIHTYIYMMFYFFREKLEQGRGFPSLQDIQDAGAIWTPPDPRYPFSIGGADNGRGFRSI